MTVVLAVALVAASATPALALGGAPPVAVGETSEVADHGGADNGRVNVSVGQQLSTVLAVSSDEVRTDFEETAFELSVEAGDALLLGPMADGSFRDVEVRSIEMHYHRVDAATAGRIVGIALKGVAESEVERGMVLLPRSADPAPVRSFEAEVMVLNHPTRIREGYEPVVHLETLSETAIFRPADGKLLPGDTGEATVEFKFRPYFLEAGQRFVFREGSSKGVGTVLSVDGDADPSD